MNKYEERLKNWIATLSDLQKERVILQLTTFAIQAEEVSMWDDTAVPYLRNTGENLDGSETTDESEE